MSAQSFQDRIRRIERNQRCYGGHNAVACTQRTDKDRLQIALKLLERTGIEKRASFPIVFEWTLRFGFVPRPLHFWSLPSLTGLVFGAMSLLFLAVILLCEASGASSGPVVTAIDAGPSVYVSLNILIAGLYACSLKSQSRRLKLPQWREL